MTLTFIIMTIDLDLEHHHPPPPSSNTQHYTPTHTTCFNGRIKLRVIFIKRLHCPESAVIWRKTLSNNYAILYAILFIYTTISNPFIMCRGGAMDECRPCNPKVRVRISWQTKILKKSLVIRVNSKSASRTGIYLKRTRVKVQLVHAWTGENKCMNRTGVTI